MLPVVPAPTPAAPPPAVIAATCPGSAAARHATCGFVSVPLDRRHPTGTRIRIYFERYPRRDTSRPAVSTVLSIQGGPGYTTTGDRAARLQLWQPISNRRDLLLVDLRGTGRSHPLFCKAFAKHILGYDARVGRCAQQLGPSRSFYDTSQSVQDLAAVLRALHIRRVDVYGDSYGSYAAQAFTVRYPSVVRSLELDGTYQLPGTDPDLADLAAATRLGLRLACERRPGCPAPGHNPVPMLAGLIARVRAHPITGVAPDGDGVPTHVRVDEAALVNLMQSGYYYTAVWGEVPAAIASAGHGDTQPLLRLVAETAIQDVPSPPGQFSEALYDAVYCHDYPQPWPDGTPIAERAAAAEARLASYPRGTFAPFSGAAWTGGDYEGALTCLRWPNAPFADPPIPPGATYPDVPTLILNGDLDNITPLADARVVASQWPKSTLVVLQNGVHVNAIEDNNDCASVIYHRFVRLLRAGNTSCGSRTPEVRTLTSFPLRLGQVAPAVSGPGDQSTLRERRLAAAAAHTVADVVERWWVNYSGTDVGLRGGHWSYSGGNVTAFTLHRVEFVPGIAVSGTVKWAYYSGAVHSQVAVRTPSGRTEHLRMVWSLQVRADRAHIDGTTGGRPLHLRMLAP